MVDGVSFPLSGGAVPGTTPPPGLAPGGSQTRTAALETAFPGLKVLGAGSDTALQQQQERRSGTTAAGTGGQKPPLSGDTLLAAQQQQGGEGAPKAPGQLTDEEKQQVAKLKQIDTKVRAHERAHQAAGGQYAGAPSYSYTRGPDGQQYAVGGEVAIDIGAERDPEATLQKATQVQAAALAPADPSGQDRAVAAAAAQLRLQALAQIRDEKRAEAEQQQADRAAEADRRQQALAANSPGPAANGQGGTSQAGETRPGEARTGTGEAAAVAGAASGAVPPGSQTPAARASSAYANDNGALNRIIGQVVGISA